MKELLRSKILLALAVFLLLVSSVFVAMSSFIMRSHAASLTPIAFSNVQGSFFNNTNNSGAFDATPSTTTVFTQSFPVIYFNPPTSMQSCSNSTGIDENARPFTDVVQNSDGTCSTIPDQDSSGDQAGVASLSSFEAEFTATITVPSAGQMASSVYSDDGWILSIGPDSNRDQPTSASGNSMTNPPAGNKGPFTGYPEMADNNSFNSPTASNATVNFPAAGSYPVEIDYTECCGGQLTLLFSSSFTPIPTPIPSPSPSPSPTPSEVSHSLATTHLVSHSTKSGITVFATTETSCENPLTLAKLREGYVVNIQAEVAATNREDTFHEQSEGEFLKIYDVLGDSIQPIDYLASREYSFTATGPDKLKACILPGTDGDGPDGDELATIAVQVAFAPPPTPTPIQNTTTAKFFLCLIDVVPIGKLVKISGSNFVQLEGKVYEVLGYSYTGLSTFTAVIQNVKTGQILEVGWTLFTALPGGSCLDLIRDLTPIRPAT